MTANEKAKEIFAKFKKATTFKYQDYAGANYSTFEHDDEILKECCLISVNEIISDCDATSPFESDRLKYWNDVKSCIDALK